MKKKSTTLIIILSAALALAACQIPTAPIEETAGGFHTTSVQAAVVEEIVTATAEPTAVPQLTAAPTTIPSATAGAEQAAQAYFEALSQRNHETAAELVSEFSLMVFRMTRLDVTDQLILASAAGANYTNFEIVESSLLDEQTALVHVRYEERVEKSEEEGDSVKESKPNDMVWAFHMENGQWRYNWNNLIDFRTLSAQAQTTGGVTMLPKEILRFTDHIQVNLLAQNRTNDPILFGQVNETLATLYFQGKMVEAEPAKIYLNPLRSYPNIALTFMGFFEDYPDRLDIRTWKSYVVDPWYSFDLPY